MCFSINNFCSSCLINITPKLTGKYDIVHVHGFTTGMLCKQFEVFRELFCFVAITTSNKHRTISRTKSEPITSDQTEYASTSRNHYTKMSLIATL